MRRPCAYAITLFRQYLALSTACAYLLNPVPPSSPNASSLGTSPARRSEEILPPFLSAKPLLNRAHQIETRHTPSGKPQDRALAPWPSIDGRQGLDASAPHSDAKRPSRRARWSRRAWSIRRDCLPADHWAGDSAHPLRPRGVGGQRSAGSVSCRSRSSYFPRFLCCAAFFLFPLGFFFSSLSESYQSCGCSSSSCIKIVRFFILKRPVRGQFSSSRLFCRVFFFFFFF